MPRPRKNSINSALTDDIETASDKSYSGIVYKAWGLTSSYWKDQCSKLVIAVATQNGRVHQDITKNCIEQIELIKNSDL